jgi:hypothetical protein
VIRRRGYGFYKPPQYLTGRIDDFPLVPETPIDIVPRPILPSAPPAALAAPVVAAPEPTPPPPCDEPVVEHLEAAKELAVTAPSVAKEVLRILESEELPPAADTVTIEVAAPKAKSRRRRESRSRHKISRTRGKKKKAPPPPKPQPASRRERHQELCGICGSEFREEIDDAFINWESVNGIAREFNIERRAVYRHAHATGLFPKRDRNIRRALGLIIHRADKVQGVTADSVIRAIHMLAHINEAGEWIAPPAHVIVSSGTPRLSNNTPPAADLLDTRCQAAKKLNP